MTNGWESDQFFTYRERILDALFKGSLACAMSGIECDDIAELILELRTIPQSSKLQKPKEKENE